MGYRKLTESQRAERRRADRERLEHAARALLSSEGWQRWVQVRSRNGLARYSFGNQLLIALQNPDASYVAGFRAFLPLQRLADELGYGVSRGPLEGSADGWCDQSNKEIVINGELPGNAQVRVLVHELAHALGIGYREHGRRRAEVIVDTVTYIVCGSLGLDTSASTVPYVAGWGEDGNLDAIRGCAEAVDRIARRIEDSLRSHSQASADEAALAA